MRTRARSLRATLQFEAPSQDLGRRRGGDQGVESMAPELLEKYQQLRFLIPGRKHVGELQFPYPEKGSLSAYTNTDKVIDPGAFYTDVTSCALGGFNLGIGESVLDREISNTPFGPDKGISYEVMEPGPSRQQGLRCARSSRVRRRSAPTRQSSASSPKNFRRDLLDEQERRPRFSRCRCQL